MLVCPAISNTIDIFSVTGPFRGSKHEGWQINNCIITIDLTLACRD
jgi:hypothetical protein